LNPGNEADVPEFPPLSSLLQLTFTLADAREITGLSSPLASSLLHKAARRGLVSRLKPGVFVIVPPELGSTSEYAGDPYLTAKRLAGDAPCFISHGSAMEIHRMVTQPRLAIFASSPKRLRGRTSPPCLLLLPETRSINLGPPAYWLDCSRVSCVCTNYSVFKEPLPHEPVNRICGLSRQRRCSSSMSSIQRQVSVFIHDKLACCSIYAKELISVLHGKAGVGHLLPCEMWKPTQMLSPSWVQ
jgi:hypothetical protein